MPASAAAAAAATSDNAVDNAVTRKDAPMAEPSRLSARTMLRGLGWDVGLPLVAYYALHLAGVADWPALLAATGLALARVVWVAVRERSLNLFGVVMVVVFGLGLVLALVSGDPRFLLLKNSFVTGAVGLVFLATVRWGTPLSLAAAERFEPGRRAQIREEYDTDPDVRHGHRVSSAVWGLGLLTEAVVRVPLVYLLPIDVMVGLGEALSVATFAGLITWNIWYVKRATAHGPADTK